MLTTVKYEGMRCIRRTGSDAVSVTPLWKNKYVDYCSSTGFLSLVAGAS
jgi:hypothetical protein